MVNDRLKKVKIICAFAHLLLRKLVAGQFDNLYENVRWNQ